MGDAKNEEKWAANFAFTGSEATVKEVKKFLDSLEASGKIDDMTGISGPHESLQLMLKRRVENLALGATSESTKPESEASGDESNSSDN